MVLMPPGSAKSTYASVIFPAWWFTKYPNSSIIAASHSASLAQNFSRKVKTLIDSHGSPLGFTTARAANTAAHWRTTSGGEYLALGVRGAIAGLRADLVIIDDPVKCLADAESPRQRNHIWEWYKSDIIPRLKPKGKVLLIMTRWHPEDLGGQLIDNAPQDWRVLRLPALAEHNDPLGRSIGEPLWPNWESGAELLKKRDLIGSRAWASLYQQSPVPTLSQLFLTERISIADGMNIDPTGSTIRAWDLAATFSARNGDPDWTVGLKLQCSPDNKYFVLDIVRIRGTPSQVEETIKQTAQTDGRHVKISLPEDPGQAGKSQIAYLTRQLAGFHVHSSRETGSKETRAMPVAPQIEAGNLFLKKSHWNNIFLEELRSFPWGSKDDQVDALSRAFNILSEQRQPTKSVNLNLLRR